MRTVSLVLGSGGARGLAHIGVIRWLEKNNYQIESISGCSMGALVGGVYAAGKLENFERWVGAGGPRVTSSVAAGHNHLKNWRDVNALFSPACQHPIPGSLPETNARSASR